MEADALRQAVRYTLALRRLRRAPVPEAATAAAVVADEVARRDQRFVDNLDDLVWSVASSPYQRLLRHAGINRDDVRALVARHGLDAALEHLRDEGVYVAYREWLGEEPARRGSATFDFTPADFFNPRVRADHQTRTGGSRTVGIPLASNVASKVASLPRTILRWDVWDVLGAPAAVWFPVLPSTAGLDTCIRFAVLGNGPERWFTQVRPGVRDIAPHKRVANAVLPLAVRAAGIRLPPPRWVPPADPAPVLEWALDALARQGRALLAAYASSGVALARLAADRGESLRGLVLSLAGEPVTAAKAAVVRRSGAALVNTYAFMQKGGVAISCPFCEDEELHVWDGDVAVVTRRVTRPDGVDVDALCWTTLQHSARSVFLNVENDDYGEVRRDVPCACRFGSLGMRTRVAHIRGISKVVAGGVTVKAELLERIVEQLLPASVGGSPGDFQFVEGDGMLGLRAAPTVPAADDDIRAAVRTLLRRSEAGVLADEVWAGDVRVWREHPKPTRSGKVLPLAPLPRDAT